MKTALTKIFKFFVNLFKRQDMKVEIFNILLAGLDSEEIKELRDADIMNKAWEFVKDLHTRTDLTGKEKAALFNEQMLKWGKKVGKVIGVASLNIIREIAYAALKIALTQGLVTLMLANGRVVTPGLNTCKPEQPEEDPNQMKLNL